MAKQILCKHCLQQVDMNEAFFGAISLLVDLDDEKNER